FTVKRVAQPRLPTDTTEPHPFVRASAVLDMPEGLDRGERQAYLRGYACACLAYHRKHGNPSPTYARANEWDRHPGAHKKGLAELAAYRERTDAFLAARSQGV